MKTGFLLLTISALALAADMPGEKAVRDSVNKFVEAAHMGDEATLKSLLGDGLVYVHSNGATVENKTQCIASLVKSKTHFELKPGWTVQMYGNTAVVHGQLISHNPSSATPVTPLDYIMTWVKTGGNWQMVARHTAKLPN